MRATINNFLCFAFGNFFLLTEGTAQSKPFVPLEFEYPSSVLTSPKTYVYKNQVTGTLRYKDVSIERKGNDVIINWKEYDASPLVDSCTEINDKTLDHYIIINGEAIKAMMAEDSVYQDGSRLGEKVQTLYFDLNNTISLFSSTHSFFLKDTTISWQEKSVPCLVIQSFQKQKLTNSLVPDKPKDSEGMIYYYFAKDVGLIMYRSETENEKTTWQLVEIRERKN